VVRAMGIWQVLHLSSSTAASPGFATVSDWTVASQYGSRAALAIMEDRHVESIETSFPDWSNMLVWQLAQAPAVEKCEPATAGKAIPSNCAGATVGAGSVVVVLGAGPVVFGEGRVEAGGTARVVGA
ncbi:MAG: hypothetical protein ACN4GK_01080, partial [Acidimicrobiia bacterium]